MAGAQAYLIEICAAGEIRAAGNPRLASESAQLAGCALRSTAAGRAVRDTDGVAVRQA